MDPKAWLITGIPGAGKTTVSRALAERFPRTAVIESDWLQESIVSGGLWPNEEPEDEAERQLSQRTARAALLADSYVDDGFVAIIDDVVPGTRRLSEYLHHLRARPVALVVLAPSVAVALQRDHDREAKEVGNLWAHLDAELRDQLASRGLWMDTSALTVEQTVDRILSDAGSAVI